VGRQNQNLQHATGRVKICGLALVVLQNLHQKIDKENISIFV